MANQDFLSWTEVKRILTRVEARDLENKGQEITRKPVAQWPVQMGGEKSPPVGGPEGGQSGGQRK